MRDTDNCCLTAKDYTILEVMLERCRGGDGPMAGILRRKLAGARLVLLDDVPPSVVTLGSRVTYRVDDAPAETRIVTQDEMRGLVGSVLPITNPRGLALLGLAEGQAMSFDRPSGVTETVTVQAVNYQPEAARREADMLAGRSRSSAMWRRPVLRLVHSATLPTPARAAMRIGDEGLDDPGPSAA